MLNFFRKNKIEDDILLNEYEILESPIWTKETQEDEDFAQLAKDVMSKLDEIKKLIIEMKNEDQKNV